MRLQGLEPWTLGLGVLYCIVAVQSAADMPYGVRTLEIIPCLKSGDNIRLVKHAVAVPVTFLIRLFELDPNGLVKPLVNQVGKLTCYDP